MNILFLSTWFPYPPDNGSKIRVYYLLNALAAHHEVTLLSFAWDTAQPQTAADLDSLCADVQTVPLNPFEVNRASTLRTFLSLKPVASRPVPSMTRLVSETLRTRSLDVVIASTEMTAAYALQAPPCIPRILEEHNSIARWSHEIYTTRTNLPQRARCWVSLNKRRYYEASLFKRFDLVAMVSERDRAYCTMHLPGYHGQVAVIPNGVDCIHHCPDLAEVRPNTLVYNGALTYSANYDAMQHFLAEMYPLIQQQIPDVTLSITGSTKGVDLSGLQMKERVHLTGYVEDIRLPVARSAACVVPIRRGGGTRLKILEAMALGTPVIATPKGAEGLHVVNGEHLLIADDPVAFAEATIRVLRNATLRSRLAANARQLVEAEYDWTKIGKQFVALVEETVLRRKRGVI